MFRRQFTALALVASLGMMAPAPAGTLLVPKDHKTIQGAIDAAAPGDTVLVAAGTYRESIRCKERVTLKSAGDDAPGKLGLKRAEATVIDGGGSAAKGPAVILAEGSILDGFTVTQVGSFDQKEYDKHYATQGEDLPDERGAVGVGAAFPAVSAAAVTAVVQHCLVHDNGRAGIGLTAGDGKRNGSLVANNIVYRNMGGGIGVADGAAPTVESNRCFNNLRGGIGNRKASGLIIGNECFDNVRAGIGVREGATPIVRGNRCYQNRRAGIGCRMARTAPLIEDNDCYQNAMAGIGCRDGARPTIVANKCYQNKEAGIGSQLKAKPVIADNECYENEKAGIGQQSDAETVLSGNFVHHNKLAGIGFDACKAGKAAVLHNRVIDNDQAAVGIHSGWNVRLADNTLSRAGGLPPIVMVFQGAEAEFVGNRIQGSGVAGIRTEGTVRVVNNAFDCPTLRKGGGPPQFAVWGLPGADIVFTANKVNGWRHALVAEKAGVNASFNQIAGYWQVGIQVKQPSAPVTALRNRFESESEHPGVQIDGSQGIVTDNRVAKPTRK